MSDMKTTSYCGDNRNDNGMSPMFLILMLLLVGGGSNGLLGGCGCNDDKGCGCGGGLDGILPIILLLTMCGGSF